MSELALQRITENKKTKAKTLDLGNCGMTEFPDLSGLVWLDTLVLSSDWWDWEKGKRFYSEYGLNNEIDRFESDHFPKNIQKLVLSGCQIRDGWFLEKLTGLTTLDVSENNLENLSPVLHLVKKGIPVVWDWGKPNQISVEDNPFTNPPIEIVKQGNAAILNYFEEKAKGETVILQEAKMLIVGEGGSGKTSLLRRLYQKNRPLPEENESTKGIEIHYHDFKMPDGSNFRLNVWDFGGQEIYHATHQFFLTKRSLYVPTTAATTQTRASIF